MMNAYKAAIKISEILAEVNNRYHGKQFRVLSNYNGQPYGRSKKSMKGEIFTVESIGFDNEGAYIFPKDHRLAISISEVEFLAEANK